MAVKQEYRQIVKTATITAGGIGVPGAFSFGVDVVALSGTWAVMILAIASKSGHEVDKPFAAKLTAGVAAGVGAYIVGSKVATQLLHLVPIAGTLAAIGINSSLNALYTYKVGSAVSVLFDKGGFEEADMADMMNGLLRVIATVPTRGEIADIILMMTKERPRLEAS